MNTSVESNVSGVTLVPVSMSDGSPSPDSLLPHWTYTNAAHLTFAFAAPTLLLLGTVFNVVAWTVFQTKNLTGNITTFYYRSLVVSDLLILHIGLWPRIIFAHLGFNVLTYSIYSCKVLSYALYYFLNFEIWAHSILTIERILGVYHPHKVMAKWTKGFAWRTLWVIAAVTVVVTLPVAFVHNVEQHRDGGASCDILPTPATQAAVWFEFIIYTFIPIIIIASGNAAINRVVFGGRMESASQVKALSSMSFIFGWLITSFCIIATPSSVIRSLSLYTTFDPLVHVVTYFFLFVHSANKIVIFRSICPRFTQEFNIMFCIEKRKAPAAVPSTRAIVKNDKNTGNTGLDNGKSEDTKKCSTTDVKVTVAEGGKV